VQKEKVMLLRGLIKLHRHSMKCEKNSKNQYKKLLEEKIQESCQHQQELVSAK